MLNLKHTVEMLQNKANWKVIRKKKNEEAEVNKRLLCKIRCNIDQPKACEKMSNVQTQYGFKGKKLNPGKIGQFLLESRQISTKQTLQQAWKSKKTLIMKTLDDTSKIYITKDYNKLRGKLETLTRNNTLSSYLKQGHFT